MTETLPPAVEAAIQLARDIATVRAVAQRRTDPDRDYLQMLARLREWEKVAHHIADSSTLAAEQARQAEREALKAAAQDEVNRIGAIVGATAQWAGAQTLFSKLFDPLYGGPVSALPPAPDGSQEG